MKIEETTEDVQFELLPDVIIPIVVLNWIAFAFILFCLNIYYENKLLEHELKINQQYSDAVNSEALQNIMCNGTSL